MTGWLPPDGGPPFFGTDRSGEAERFTRAWRSVDMAAYEGGVVGAQVGAWAERVATRAVTAVARVVGVRVVRWLRGAS